MKNLTTPQAILCGFGLVALAIASVPYSSQIVKPAYASSGVNKIAICNEYGNVSDVLIRFNVIMQIRVRNKSDKLKCKWSLSF